MSKNTKITFIRHATSKTNEDTHKLNVIGGHELDVLLSEEGKEQAKNLGEYFKKTNTQFNKAYSSTAVRTLSTSAFCFKKMGCKLPVILDKQLLGQNQGDWEGKSRETIYNRPDVASELKSDNWGSIPGDIDKGESKETVAKRLIAWINELLTKDTSDQDQNIIVFTHGLAIKFLLAELLNLDRSTAYKEEINPVANASITELNYCDNVFQSVTKRNFVP